VIACQEGRFPDAVGLLEAAIAEDGQNAVYHSNLGVALKGVGRAEDALLTIQQAERLAPDDNDIRFNVACLLQELGRSDQAISAYEAILKKDPDHADALSNLGALLLEAGRAELALPLLQHALVKNPELSVARINLGLALHELERLEEAASCFREAIAAEPIRADLYFNLANTLHADRRYEEAIACGERAIALKPDYAEAYHNIGNGWREIGDTETAVRRYRDALRLNPDNASAWRNLLSTLLYRPDVPPARRLAEHLQFSARYPTSTHRHSAVMDPERPLRVGYISSDFRQHPVARNLEPLFADRPAGNVFNAVYAQVRQPDDVTARFRARADLWRLILGLSDEAVVEQIRADRIDILVHLAGRFDRNRPALAAGRAAPIQISFHDPATSGFPAVDYLIADRFMVPRSGSERFTERVLRLPSFYTHAPLPDASDPGPLPAGTAGPITFVSFNHPAKLNPRVLGVWGDILRSVPGSRLLLRHRHRFSSIALQERVLSGLAAIGVDRNRVLFQAGDSSRGDHLSLYCQTDIALDPWPFTGSTTTFEALSMGVPVVTLAADTMVGRWSGSMLHALELDELIASSEEEYVVIARRLAADLTYLAKLRRSLRPLLAASPLCNGPLRARQIERLYRAVWRRWCAAARASRDDAS
jgi:predicted O-linked N-acetylglucosamine transferase (SPINDLY family)